MIKQDRIFNFDTISKNQVAVMHKRVCAMNAMQLTVDNNYHIRSKKTASIDSR